MAAHCARTSAFAAGLFISPHEQGREGRERERERERGPLEAEHGLGVIKEMNGYRGGDFFHSIFFGMHRPIRNVRPFAPFRSSARRIQGVPPTITWKYHPCNFVTKNIPDLDYLIRGYNNHFYNNHLLSTIIIRAIIAS